MQFLMSAFLTQRNGRNSKEEREVFFKLIVAARICIGISSGIPLGGFFSGIPLR
jgi:hypothetical protein